MKDSAPKPRTRRPRWVRFGVAVLLLGLLSLIAVSIAGAYAYRNRTSLTNRILRQTFSAFDAQVGAIEITQKGIDIAQITFRDPKSKAQILAVDSVTWRPSWSKVSSGDLGRFSLTGAHLKAKAEQLRSWMSANAQDLAEPTPAAASSGFRLPPLSLSFSELRDVSVDIEGDEKTPSISFRLEHTIEDLNLLDLSRPKLAHASLKITDLAITPPQGDPILVPELTAAASLKSEDGMIRIETLELRGARIRLTPPLREWLAQFSSAPDTEAAAPMDLPWLKGVIIQRLIVDDGELNIEKDALGAAYPARGGLHLHYEMYDLEWRPDQPLRMGDHRLEMTDFSIHPQSDAGGILIPKLWVEMNDVDPSRGWILDRFSLENPRIEWTQALEDLFIRAPTSASASPPTSRAPAKSLALLIQKLAITDASLDVKPTRLSPLIGSLHASLDLQHLSLGSGGIHAQDAQKLRLDQVSLSLPNASGDAEEPLFKTASAELQITPSLLEKTGRIDRLVITQPEIHLTEKTAPWMKKAEPDSTAPSNKPAPQASAPAQAPESAPPFWQRLNFADLAISDGKFEFATSGTGRIQAGTSFALTTEPAPDADIESPVHHLRLTDARGMIPDIAKLPVAGIQLIEAAVRLPHLWRDRQIESLKIKGGQIEAGDALMSLFNGTTSESPPPADDATPPPSDEKPAPAAAEQTPATSTAEPKPKWKVGTIEVGDVAVTLQKLAPGLPSVRFEVNLQAQDTPLEMEQLAQHVVKQRVELSNLTIPSPYDPLRTVARLDTIFVDFTLDGVFAERLDKVEIVSPTLYVGEDLFWYVDYFRKYAAGEIKSAKDSPKLVSSDKAVALAAAKEISESPPKKKGWSVDVLQVHSGKLVLAPKGVPLPGFGQPFPFSFITQLDDGRFDATLDIPPDTYTLPDLKLEFRGMKGKVEFNLPMKGVSNNLSEVFRVDQIRWKDLHIEDAHMSLTYDMNGMYGQFGGAAYEGYLNGAFNVYFDQSYSWDGWIAASGIRTTEITEKMTPAYFVLNGKVDCKVVANGSSQELYQADLSFKNVTPGQFSVAGLNDMIKEYADYGTVDLTSQITRIGLETLRDFEYDTVDGEGRFYGREGKGHLRFKGPTGVRNFDINVLDHRWKDDPKKKPEEKDENPLAQP